MRPGQRHTHGGEGGPQPHHGLQQQSQQPEQQRQAVHQPIGQVVAWGIVAQPHQQLGHEVPELYRLIIGDMVGLKWGGRRGLKGNYQSFARDAASIVQPEGPYSATEGRLGTQVLSGQYEPMDHVLHKGEVHQVAPIPAYTQSRAATRQWSPGETQQHLLLQGGYATLTR